MNPHVLIIDDSPILRRSVRRALGQAGISDDRILEASNGAEGLEVVEANQISLVLLDLNMPVMNGEEFLIRLRGKYARDDVQVVVVTTESNAARLIRLSQLGISGFLHKPFELEDLRQLAGEVLGPAS